MTLPEDKIKVAIMASGSGSNAENLIRYAQSTKLFSVECVIVDNEKAFVIERCKKLNVECFIISIKNKKDQESHVLTTLKNHKVTWVFLAGYMRILSQNFINYFWDFKTGVSQIINIHPSLLPSFPGVDAYKQAWNAKVTQSGVSVHRVDAGVDTGPVIVQKSFARLEEDNFESFKARGMKIEHELYKKAANKLFSKDIISTDCCFQSDSSIKKECCLEKTVDKLSFSRGDL